MAEKRKGLTWGGGEFCMRYRAEVKSNWMG